MIALVDCNNFYCSCERVFNPQLRDKSVVVLSNNDGCVVARSNEVKAMGIKMGTPLYQPHHPPAGTNQRPSGTCEHRSPGPPYGFPKRGRLPVQESRCHGLEHSS